jgi:hypothetical protein
MLTIQASLDSAAAATTANLAATYVAGSTDANGGTGVGATLTAVANGALVVDGYAASTGDRILVNNQLDAKQNGVYSVTNPGSALAPWVLTRATDFDDHVVNQVKQGVYIFVLNGTLNAGTGWIQGNTGSGIGGVIIIGTDLITFVESNTVAYQFLPGTLVYVVSAATFGIGKATVQSISISSATANIITTTYNVQYLNQTRTANGVDSSQVFANVDAAVASYVPQIT